MRAHGSQYLLCTFCSNQTCRKRDVKPVKHPPGAFEAGDAQQRHSFGIQVGERGGEVIFKRWQRKQRCLVLDVLDSRSSALCPTMFAKMRRNMRIELRWGRRKFH